MDVQSILNNFSWADILDICLVTIILYHLILVIKRTRAMPALYGLGLIAATFFMARQFGFISLTWLLEAVLNSLFFLIIIVFQAEIRHALVSLGAREWWVSFFRAGHKIRPELAIVCDAAEYMAARNIGALIVFACNVPLGDTAERGVSINAEISKELLISIFWHNTPLHDGAVIITGNKLSAAGCILPLSSSVTKWDYGTRHRAAMGITEATDAVALVVSEERGTVALSVKGRMTDTLEGPKLLRVLTAALEKTL